MKLAEIESKIAALKKRYAELDAKSVNAGVFDGGVMSAMGVVDVELKRLNALREKALVADVVEVEAAAPAAAKSAALLPLPRDFARSDDDVNPLDDLAAMPDGEAGVDVRNKLHTFMLGRTGEYLRGARAAQKSVRQAAYTQEQHMAFTAMFALIQTEYRLLSAFGRDRRNELEKRLLERIEALESRTADFKYCGTWKSDALYRTGNFVTDGGSLFHANRASIGERPGASDSFTLAVKRGANGKDAKL